jgi:hypothetical protein
MLVLGISIQLPVNFVHFTFGNDPGLLKVAPYVRVCLELVVIEKEFIECSTRSIYIDSLLTNGRKRRKENDNVQADDRERDPGRPPDGGVLVADWYQEEEDTDYNDNPESYAEYDV